MPTKGVGAFMTAKNETIWFKLLSMTVVCTTASLLATYGIMDWVFGIGGDKSYSGALVLKVGTVCAVVIPIILAPAVSYLPMCAQRDIERERIRMEELALTDALTGLFNRRGFDLAAGDCVGRAQEREDVVSVLMLDLDRFKQLNDRHGHSVGDAALIRVADLLRRVRDEDGAIVARYGGEEFVCLVSGTAARANAIAERLRSDIAAATIAVGAERAHMSASIGAATAPAGSTPLAQMIEAADRALYEAKAAGRDRVVVALAKAA